MVKSRSAWSNIITRMRIPVRSASPVNIAFQYKGYQVEITGDPSAPTITAGGKDYTPFYKGSDLSPEMWIIGHIDAQARSMLEFKLRDTANTASTADAAYQALLSKKVAEVAEVAEARGESMMDAYKRRNRISKVVRIVAANILGLPVYMLFHRIGLDWASWPVMIVVVVYSMIILVR
jgi:hypothetical protein